MGHRLENGLRGAIVATLGVLLAAPPAAGNPLEFSLSFTTTAPGAPTGVSNRIVYSTGPGGKPRPIRRLVLELPEGSRFDESAVPACVASDLELTATIDSCPPATRLGGGSGTVVTGFGPPIDPIAGDFHLYHGSGELIGVGTLPGGRSALTIGRLKIEGSTLVNPSIQPTPGGPPDGETVAAETEVQFPPRVTTAGGIQHAFLSAPDVCPSSGRWTSRLTTTFSDGSAETAATTLPCSPPSLRLWVRPRRTTVGRRTRFRFRVKSARPQCVRGALIRFKGRRVRTDQNGFASLRKRFLHSGGRHARASQTGCGEARARVRVRRR